VIEATVVYIFRDRKVLLGEKTRLYCSGRLAPPGGKIKIGEAMPESAIRETQEECGLIPRLTRQPLGNVMCYHESDLEDILVHVFRTKSFSGQPRDSAELKDVRWYPLKDSVLERMMDGDKAWFSYVVRNERFEAQVWYDKDRRLSRPPLVRSLASLPLPRLP